MSVWKASVGKGLRKFVKTKRFTYANVNDDKGEPVS